MDKRHEQTLLQRRHPDGQRHMNKMPNITHHRGNTNQNYNEIPPHTCQMANINNTRTTGLDKDAEKGEPSCTVGGNANWCSLSGKQDGNRTTL